MTLSEVEAFFETFSTHIPEIKQVVFGDEEAIANRQSSNIIYPCMWVETPFVTPISDPPSKILRYQITFLKNVSRQNEKDERAARSMTLTIAEKAWALIEAGEEQGLFEFLRNQDEGEPILKYSGDNDTGWQFTARLRVGGDAC
ncbi:MAG: hypothetical protein JNM22_05685 [Saprospiraceae bacterium]|nr:hypothetical protein [Saprospiraceae bacterium]